MSENLKNLSKDELLKQIRLLQKEYGIRKKENKEYKENNDDVLHELHVHQIELEVQNRELREAQQQLEETRDSYADLYDFAPVNYFTFDEQGQIKNINLTGASLLGKVRANVIGHHFMRWLDKDNAKLFRKHLHNTIESDIKISDELKIKNEAGELFEVRIESIRSHNAIAGENECRSIIIDVSESNRIKNKLFLQARQLRLITDALPVLIAYIDANENHLFANKTYVNSFDLSFDEVINHSASDVWGKETYKEIQKHLRLAMAGRLTKFELELPLGDTGKKYFHATLIPDTDQASEIYGVIVLIGDITNRLAIESIDRKRLLEVAQMSRLSTMGEMATEIAHELNQPLAAISIYSDACRRLVMACNCNNNEKIQQIIQPLNDINVQAERAGDVIRSIREFTSKKDLHRNYYNINSIVKESLQLLKVEMRAHNINLKLSLADDLPEVFIDKILIEQVIFNLIRNAIEAMDTIDVCQHELLIQTTQGKLNEVEVSIDDAGPGLSVDEIKNIFKPFHTTKSEGMGMGLTISHSIIAAHHGRIWAAQNNHGGTTFVFTIPKIIEDDDNAA